MAVHPDGTDAVARARAQLDLGVALRRAGRRLEAREPLRVAVDLAHRCGATSLEDQALSELRATGARPRRPLLTGVGALTPSERRIADLAAAGRLNRQIADELVVTVATVEYHLRQAYRKLGIASRRGLRDALGMQRGDVRPTLNIRVPSGLPAAPSAAPTSFASSLYRSRSAPIPESVYSRWESRSSTRSSTL